MCVKWKNPNRKQLVIDQVICCGEVYCRGLSIGLSHVMPVTLCDPTNTFSELQSLLNTVFSCLFKCDICVSYVSMLIRFTRAAFNFPVVQLECGCATMTSHGCLLQWSTISLSYVSSC